MKAFVYFVIATIFPTLILFLTNLITEILPDLIAGIIFLVSYGLGTFFFSYYIGRKEKLETVRLYLDFTFILKMILNILIFNIIGFEYNIAYLFLVMPIFGWFLFSNFLIFIGVKIGLSKRSERLEISPLKRACFYILVIIFALMNYINYNYCTISGWACDDNVIAFINTLLIIPLIELVYTIGKSKQLIKIGILLLIIFIACDLELYIIKKTNEYNLCPCTLAPENCIKNGKTYCEFIGTDGKTLCEKDCSQYIIIP